MITLTMNGLPATVEGGTTILETARFLGFPIPTLCHLEGLSPYGACRLCVVEIGEGEAAQLVTSCTYPVREGLKVRTASRRVIRARKMIIELLVASCPQSKVIQDLASQHGVRRQRFKQEYEDCILCGLCVRICSEQMMANAIGFRGRGERRSIGTPFDITSEACRGCGGCMYVCPACQQRCLGPETAERSLCGSCQNLQPSCLKVYPEYMCYMGETGSCGCCIREPEEAVTEIPVTGGTPTATG